MRWSSCRTNPWGQEQLYEPSLLSQEWEQLPLLSLHSLISVHKHKNIEKLQTDPLLVFIFKIVHLLVSIILKKFNKNADINFLLDVHSMAVKMMNDNTVTGPLYQCTT